MTGPELELAAPGDPEILTPGALALVARLHGELNETRLELLRRRHERQRDLAAGARPELVASPDPSAWKVAPAPADLVDRRCEITGPADRKMMINALNSGARVFMCDFEDSCSPTWANIVAGQRNVHDAVLGTISLETAGKRYELNADPATLMLRPRGWHLDEPRVRVGGTPVSASLFDFGVAFFKNAPELLARGSGPYFYLPKLESHEEARLWARAFAIAEETLGIPTGSIRCTVLIETILAAFEMDAILYELRDYGCSLNAGRWDYIFSTIKKLGAVLPDRSQVTMTVPFMRAYTELLVQSCHRRGAHAIGGMAAFIPSRRDPDLNAIAIARVREDKLRESRDGFDGTWVAHPDLVPIATEVFDEALGGRPNQLERLRTDVTVDLGALTDFAVPGGEITLDGLRSNVSVGARYLDAWLHGSGAAAIDNLMEDVATAEIARSQVWSWVDSGRFSEGEVRRELEQVEASDEAKELFAEVALGAELVEFLTLPGCVRLAG
ncbi:MAG TPA: malate synthase A [Gaiellaceae bacterium]|nr:malate synthase A [Gaiellaceae bacterium]